MSKIYETKKDRRTIYLSPEVNKLLTDYAYEHYHKRGKSPNYSEIIEQGLKFYFEVYDLHREGDAMRYNICTIQGIIDDLIKDKVADEGE